MTKPTEMQGRKVSKQRILALAYMNEGLQGQDFHVYQLHPEYCEKPIPKYDPQRAKQLLKEAGYPNGLDVNLAVGTWPEVVRYAEILKQDAARIIYVSCNPVTQARDLKTLLESGYVISDCRLFDFYPQTSYMESVIKLEKHW